MTDRYEKIRQALANGPTPGPWEPVTDRQFSDLPYLVLGAGTSGAKSAECLLMDTRNDAAQSRWWASAHEALEQWRQSVQAMEASIDAAQPEASTTLEQAESHARICAKLAEEHKHDVLLAVALTDAAAIIRDLLRELRRETERRWEGNRQAAQEHVEDMRDVLKEAAQVCKDLDDEALAKENRLACGAECAAAIADLAVRWNVSFDEEGEQQ